MANAHPGTDSDGTRTGFGRDVDPWVFGPVPMFAGYAAFGLVGLVATGTLIWMLALARMRRLRAAPARTGTGWDAMIAGLDRALTRGATVVCAVVEIDDHRALGERVDPATLTRLLRSCEDRLNAGLDGDDVAIRLAGPAFAIALSPARDPGLEATLRFVAGIQRRLSAPFEIDGVPIRVTCSAGFAASDRLAVPTGTCLVHAATAALAEARRRGPGAIRSYSAAMQARALSRRSLSSEVGPALRRGDIAAHFQPQIDAATGRVTGIETLARWHHPDRGLIPPCEFLPALRQAGAMQALGARMMDEALGALSAWDGKGLSVPRIGVNFSTEELGDPDLAPRLDAAITRAGLTADRLVVEVLETVVAGGADETIVRNLSALAEMGCALDLDDFGTGHASITCIRRFSIGRIKIDRSFVAGIDHDPEQRAMVCAILTMADRLGLAALGEGVETEGERRVLAELGCGDLQGFAVARPMPMAQATDWIAARAGRLDGPVAMRRLAG